MWCGRCGTRGATWSGARLIEVVRCKSAQSAHGDGPDETVCCSGSKKAGSLSGRWAGGPGGRGPDCCMRLGNAGRPDPSGSRTDAVTKKGNWSG